MKPLRVLQLNKLHFPYGGIERVCLQEAELLRAAGHAVGVFASRHPGNLPAGGDEVHFAPELVPVRNGLSARALKAARDYLWSPVAARGLRRLVRSRGPFDVAHLHGIHRYLSGSVIPELARERIPMVMTLHDYRAVCGAGYLQNRGETCERCAGGRFSAMLSARCCDGSLARSAFGMLEMNAYRRWPGWLRRVARFISPSEFHAAKLREMGFAGETRVIPNPVELPAVPRPYDEATPGRLLYAGRLSPEKGADLLVEAAGLLAGESPALTLVLCGDGPQRAALEERAAALGLAARVRFAGHLDRASLEREIAAAEAVIVPSRTYESQCLAVLEGFGGARPVIGSDAGAVREQLAPDAGIPFAPGDPAALAAAIRALLARPAAERAAMGLAGRAFAERHGDPARHLERLLAVYREAMETS